MRTKRPRGGFEPPAWRRALLRLVLAAALAGSLDAINLTVSGSWTNVIDVSDLQGGPGSDLIASYESPLNQIALTISSASGLNWQISVRKIDSVWNASLQLAAKRTSSGSGTGTVSGGTSYLTLTSTDQTLFTGRGNKSSVAIRLRLSGVSVDIPPNTYSTTVVYTVVQTS